MKRKRKLLLWLPILILLCAALTVFCAAAEETGTDVATFVFKKGDEVLATQTYAEGETVGFTLNTTASVKTLEIDLHNFFAKFDSVTLTKDGEAITAEALPSTVGSEDLGHTYEIQMAGDNTIKVFAEIKNNVTNAIEYVVDTTALEKSEKLSNALGANNTLKITFHANGTFNGLNFSTSTSLIRIDFNGQKLTAGNVDYLFKFSANKTSSQHYFYSSQPGAEITATNATFLDASKKHTFNIGSVNFGSTNITKADGANLSIAARALLVSNSYSQTCNVEGITYRQTTPSAGNTNVRALCYVMGGSDVSNPNLNIKNATMYLESGSFAAVKDTASGKMCTVTVENSELYLRSGVTYRNDETYAAKTTINLSTDTKIFSADKLNSLVEGRIFARRNQKTVGRVTFLYEWVAESDCATARWKDGDATLSEEVWKVGEMPVYEKSLFGSYSRYAEASEGIAVDTDYPTDVKTTASKVSGNLTLYANITFNLYFKKDGYITGVTYNGETVTFTEADLDSTGEYYIFKISDIAPKDLADAFTLDVLLANGEKTATYTVRTSLAKYASSVLASEESEEGKTLVLALLDYVREMSVVLGDKTVDDAGIRAIDAGLKQYGYTRQTWTGTVTIPTAGNITAASLHLASDPGFIFCLNSEKYGAADEVTLTLNGAEKTYRVHHAEGNNAYILVDSIHVSKYTDDLTVTLEGDTFTYNLGVYLAGFEETIPDYAHALYSYSLAAKAYLAATAGN